jgi:hypothetical protein
VSSGFDSEMAAPMPPWLLDCLALGALGAALVARYLAERARYRIACAECYDEGRLAGAIAGARAYAQGYRAAVPGRPAE